MNAFRQALDAYLAGRSALPAVERELTLSLAREPHMAAAHGAYVEALYRSGRIQGEVYLALVQLVRQQQSRAAPAAAPVPAAAAAAPATPASAPAPVAAPTSAEPASDKTQFRAPKPAAPAQPAVADAAADKTQFRPPKPTPAVRPPEPALAASAAVSSADPSWVPTTGPTTGTTTGSTTGSTTGTGRRTGSSWSEVARMADADLPPLTAGSVIKERFVLEEEIGRGGMGLVFKARDLRKEEAQDRNPYVAIKLLNEEFKRHPESLKALQRESRKAQNLAHPNVVTVYDFDRDGPNVYMVMELLEGEALDRVVKGVRDVGLEKKEALRMTRDICRAMAYAHEQGIVHSDFKPANAFLTREGVVKVFDFGIARAAKRSDKAAGTTTLFDPGTLGALTPAYASCEMIEGIDPDPRDDVYAIACVAYELLTGRHPFDRRSAVQARDARLVARTPPGLSRPQARALQRGLAFRREDRPASALEFLNGIMPPKRSAAVYIGGAAAAIALIVVAAVIVPGQIAKHREQTLITALATGQAARIDPVLPGLKALASSERNVVLANTEARDGLIDYFKEQIATATDVAHGHYDFPKADTLAASLRAFFGTDYAKVNDIIDQLNNHKNDEIKHQRDRFDAALSRGLLIPSQGADSVEAVLAVVRAIQPDHVLLRDERLPLEYAKQIHIALDRSNTALAQALVDSGLKLSPGDAALRDLRDQTQAAAHKVERATRVAALERSLGSLLGAGTALAAYDARRADIAELRSLGAQSRVLADVQTSAQRQVDREIQTLLGSQKFDEAEAFLTHYGDLAGPAFVEGRHQAIIDSRLRFQGKQAEVAHQKEASIANLKAQIAALLNKGKPDENWDASLKGGLQKLTAYLPANDPYFSQVNESAAAVYLGEERSLRQAQRLTEAERMLEHAREYAPQLKDLPSETRLLASAREQQAADAKVREQHAQIDALKAKLKDQAKADDVTEAQNTLAQLRTTQPNDPFTTRDGPEAIAQSYLRLAGRRVEKGGYDDALKMLDHGRDMARGVASPVVADLDNARGRYTRYQALERSFTSDAVPDANAVRSELDQLSRLDVRETRGVRQRLSQALATRMKQAGGTRAEQLMTAGHAIFPEESAFAPKPAATAVVARSTTPQPAPLQPAPVQEAPAQPTPAPQPAAAPSSTSTQAPPPATVSMETGKSPGSAAIRGKASAASTPGSAAQPAAGTAEIPIPSSVPSPEPCNAAKPGYGRRTQGQCFDAFVGGQGPTLVVIPGIGSGPSFAIGRTEVTNADYGLYCSLSKSCRSPGGGANLPLTSVSLRDAQHYMEWLSKIAGTTYRLPSDAEWSYAVKAQGAAKSPKDDPGSINCAVDVGGKRVRGLELQAVTTGPENGWGLYDYVGNAQQWVTSGGSVAARGGAYTDNLSQCTTDMTRSHSGGADAITGFRVLREIK